MKKETNIANHGPRTFGTELHNIMQPRNITIIDTKLQYCSLVNPQLVSEYSDDIYSHLDHSEVLFNLKQISYLAPPGYMNVFQTEINPSMRAILIDWIMQVIVKLNMCDETFFLAVNLIDRYLAIHQIKKFQLQIVGIASMFIASKFNEIDPPTLQVFANISNNFCNKFDISRIEGQILQTIEFQLLYVSPLQFLNRYSQTIDKQSLQLSTFILQLLAHDYNSLNYQPSLQAAGALYTVQKLLNKDSRILSTYNVESLDICRDYILKVMRMYQDCKGVCKRYTQLLESIQFNSFFL